MIPDEILAHAINLMVDAICVVDVDGHFLYVSNAFERIFGYRADEVLGRQMLDLVHPEDHERTLGAVVHIQAGIDQLHFENRYLRKDGGIVHIMWSARWSPDYRFRVAVARDVTARKRAEATQAALYAISEASHAAVDLATLCHRIDDIVAPLAPFADCRVEMPAGEGRDLEAGRAAQEDDPPGDEAAVRLDALMRAVIATASPHAIDVDSLHVEALDERPDVLQSIAWIGLPLRTRDQVVGALLFRGTNAATHCTAADLALLEFASAQVASAIERKAFEARLVHGAGHDPLTGLPNRSLVEDRMTAALSHANRDDSGGDVWLLYLDVDRFKDVNDRLGHGVGDRLLGELAHRLRRCVRESDTVGRIGGDEFVVIVEKVKSPEVAWSVAEKIRLAAMAEIDVGGCSLSVSVSIGIARYPDHGHDGQRLLERADEAMYRSKKEGGNRITVARRADDASD